MGSTRLPGKVLKNVGEKPLLLHMIERVRKSKKLDKVIVATSILEKDNIIEDFCKENNIDYFRGSESDVLQRYYECAKSYSLDIVVRLTADCPLIDFFMIDKCLENFNENSELSYYANTCPTNLSTYPNGSDIEVFSFNALEKANALENSLEGREHVTHYMCREKEIFKTGMLKNSQDWSGYRYTVDNHEDFEVVSFIFDELNKRKIDGTTREIIEILNEHPNIRVLNKKYV
jgi:spore coat polysaccharide biosynthesis protein SpsF